MEKYIDSLQESIDATNTFENIAVKAFQSMEDSIVEFAMTGKLNFTNLIDSMIADIVRFQVRSAIIEPLARSFAAGTLFSGFGGGTATPAVSPGAGWAKGAVASGGISAYSNTVVSTPTIVPNTNQLTAYANGGALFGEAGPEAIMPLTRTSGGELGVKAEAATPNVEINLIGLQQGVQEQRTTQTSQGQRIDIIFEEQVNSLLQGNNRVTNTLSRRFGVNPMLTGR
jgi:lambda family phage tail tape measure protein